MANPRIVLNELKWKEEFDINFAEIWYVHRGAPNNIKIITGRDIINLEKSFMKTNTSMIPYHRIIRIVYKNKIIFERRKN
jgi:uncharacterized protein